MTTERRPTSTFAPVLRPSLLAIYDLLEAAYGPQGWWPGEGGIEMVAGAILTQNTAWPNVERALANLRAAGALDPEALLALPEVELAQLIRPSGSFNAKARTLRAFAQMLAQDFRGRLDLLLALPLNKLRPRLLTTYGIGPETADDIVLYGAGQASFVVDAYTRRIFGRLGIMPADDRYETWRRLFVDALPSDAPLFNEYHALIVRHAKVSCRTRPRCEACVLRSLCPGGVVQGTERSP
jgi:endonuclease-3 related protein